jgi:capping protein beta
MRRLPPQQIEKNLSDLIDLVPDLCEELLSSIDQPLKIATDKKVGKDYLLCDYNRDGDSYRYNVDMPGSNNLNQWPSTLCSL